MAWPLWNNTSGADKVKSATGGTRPSVPAARNRSAFRFAREQDRDAGKHQHDANHCKGIAETHHQRLPLDVIAERADGLLMGRRPIALAVREEEVGHLLDPGADCLAAKMD